MKKIILFTVLGVLLLSALVSIVPAQEQSAQEQSAQEQSVFRPQEPVSLDGIWQIATDPDNRGKSENWQAGPRPDAVKLAVPSVLQQAFPEYQGLVWYWREFMAPVRAIPDGRFLLRFEQVDYFCEVWINDNPVGAHEGGETPFTLDVTDAILPGQRNRIAVRVLNPTDKPVDGMVFSQTPHRAKSVKFWSGAQYNHGGITRSVELRLVPPVYVTDLFVDTRISGSLKATATIRNASGKPVETSVRFAYGDGRSGDTFQTWTKQERIPVGDSTVAFETILSQPRLWNLNDPYLYRGTVSVEPTADSLAAESSARASADSLAKEPVSVPYVSQRSERFGFREFKFSDGYFRLNGKRIYLKSTHTVNNYPVGLSFPHDPDLFKRDLINLKAMGFNMVRFIWGGAVKEQLDFCDELGLMVYNESFAADMWLTASDQLERRFHAAVEDLIRRDRNHPSVVIWGLLNEVGRNKPTFALAANMLPRIRKLDGGRVVFLNSGRWDKQVEMPRWILDSRLDLWSFNVDAQEPHVGFNPTDETIDTLGICWGAKRIGMHPGPYGEFSVVRWRAEEDGTANIAGTFESLAKAATTDVHILSDGKPLFESFLNLGGRAGLERFDLKDQAVRKGQTIDFVVGFGNGSYGSDSTGLSVTIDFRAATGNVQTFNPAADFNADANPSGAWEFGSFVPKSQLSDKFNINSFRRFSSNRKEKTVSSDPAKSSDPAALPPVGTFANPDSIVWDDSLDDSHQYKRVPHTAELIRQLREEGKGSANPTYFAEYGIGSATDLIRTVRFFEQLGLDHLQDARQYRAWMDQYYADWEKWKLSETFDRPEDFFAESLAKMAGQRTIGLNAVRSNPYLVGHNLTGGIDHVMTGEGLTTPFRELKRGAVDAVFDAWAPLRWNTFVEPVHGYANRSFHLEAVLSNEDALKPGEYPVRAEVFDPDGKRLYQKDFSVTIPEPTADNKPEPEPPFAKRYLSDDLVLDGPTGKYRLVVTFLKGAAAAGGETFFHVTRQSDMTKVSRPFALWTDDPELKAKLESLPGLKPVSEGANTTAIPADVVLLIGNRIDRVKELDQRVRDGATVVFLSPGALTEGTDVAKAFLDDKGAFKSLYSWLYLKDEWSKPSPFFSGAPSRGLMDNQYYRELISDLCFVDTVVPEQAVAGAIHASQGYQSGLTLAVYPHGKGRIVVNTFRIIESLNQNPAAEILLRNLIQYSSK